MRSKRVKKFKRYRHRKMRNIFLLGVVFPFASILLGYVITAIFILPSMSR